MQLFEHLVRHCFRQVFEFQLIHFDHHFQRVFFFLLFLRTYVLFTTINEYVIAFLLIQSLELFVLGVVQRLVLQISAHILFDFFDLLEKVLILLKVDSNLI